MYLSTSARIKDIKVDIPWYKYHEALFMTAHPGNQPVRAKSHKPPGLGMV